MTLRAITKSVSFDAPGGELFSILADTCNWPRWAVINVLHIGEYCDRWWEMRTRDGEAKLRIEGDAPRDHQNWEGAGCAGIRSTINA